MVAHLRTVDAKTLLDLSISVPMEKGYSQDMAFSPVGKTLLDLSISVPMEKGYSQDMAFSPVGKDSRFIYISSNGEGVLSGHGFCSSQ